MRSLKGGVVMVGIFDIKKLGMENFYFIAHRFDKILIGEKHRRNAKRMSSSKTHEYQELERALADDQIMEIHVFDGKKEIFAVRSDKGLEMYKPLEITKGGVEREYRLNKKVFEKENKEKRLIYNTLVTREYMRNDPETKLAYIDRTVLLEMRLYERDEKGDGHVE